MEISLAPSPHTSLGETLELLPSNKDSHSPKDFDREIGCC